MLLIYLKNKLNLFVYTFAVGVLSTNVYAGRVGDGRVLVEVKNNNVCFSVSKYKPRGYFFKSFKVGPQGLNISSIGISRHQRGAIWQQNQPINGGEFNLKPNQCLAYDAFLKNYNLKGDIQSLNSGKFTVIITGYDIGADQWADFIGVFAVDVSNGKVTLKK